MILELCLIAAINGEQIIKACDNSGNIFAVNSHGIVRLNDAETKRLDNTDATSERVTLIGFKLPAKHEDLRK